MNYKLDDFAEITLIALLLVGDRDDFCPVEQGAAAYRKLGDGEVAVLPNTGHLITAAQIELMVDFLKHRSRSRYGRCRTRAAG
jgi:pimeloyl-ACP methyl ester carboxylesterase